MENTLNKGLKSELIICKDKLTNESLETLISLYNESQQNRKFKGISHLFISNLSKQHESINWKFNIYFAYHKDDIDKLSPFGSLLSIISGDTCTYVIGTTNDNGRKLKASNFLLWQAILDSKNSVVTGLILVV